MKDYKYFHQDWLRMWWNTRVVSGLTRHDWVWVIASIILFAIIYALFPGWDFSWGKR